MNNEFSPIEITPTVLSDLDSLPSFTNDLGEQFNSLLAQYKNLSHQYSWLKRQLFGQKSERFIPNDEQLVLNLGAEEKSPPVTTQSISYDRKHPGKKQKKTFRPGRRRTV